MRDDSRPDPDAILAAIRSDEAKARRGHLRIFFGMCPGVGKTFAMLQAARRKIAEGVEVVVGIVETHGRADTLALTEGMPIVPRMKIEHRGTMLEEMDFEAIMLWHPKLVLVDELAHSNAPGARHPKRYQDVLELLDAGIDVFTTLNVQHVESRTDAVRQATGVVVRESVPDSLLDLADEIELVDITPGQLRQRLAEGCVYLGERATAAGDNFFREENLTALREMALRLTAEHVDRRLRVMRPASQREHMRNRDRLLVAVSGSPHSAELVRWTRRYASSMEAPWFAVGVESPEPLSPEDEKRRSANLALARQLGAEVILTSGTHIGKALLAAARENAVTQIVLGKPEGAAWRWPWRRKSPVAWLIEHSGRIDVQLVRTEAPSEEAPVQAAASESERWRGFAAAIGIAAATTLLGKLLVPFAGYWSIAVLYLLTVTIGGVALRRWPVLLLATLNALLWNFLFIPPLYTFHISEPSDAMMFAMFFVVALVIGQLTSRLSERERLEHRREGRATALYRLTRALAAAPSRDAAVREVVTQVRKVFALDAAVLLRDEDGVFNTGIQDTSTWRMPAKEEAVAALAFQKRRAAGRGTDTLPDAAGLHLPLVVSDRIEGVLAVALPDGGTLSTEQRDLLEAFAAQLAVVAETQRLAVAERRAQVLADSERLQKTLFDSVSHELKTPIAAITAALEQPQPDIAAIRTANERLRRTVEHLLSVTRIESGLVKPAPEWCDATELAHDAIALAGAAERIGIAAPEGLPLLLVDAGLTAQTLATLIENALTHGHSPEPPVLAIKASDGFVRFDVADRGRGLQPGTEEKVFGRFFRAEGTPAGGTGLGLAIARHLAEVQGGTLTAENRPAGGARFTLALPTGGKARIPE